MRTLMALVVAAAGIVAPAVASAQIHCFTRTLPAGGQMSTCTTSRELCAEARQGFFDRGATVTPCAPRPSMVCYRYSAGAEGDDEDPPTEEVACFATMPDCQADSATRRRANRDGRLSNFTECLVITAAMFRELERQDAQRRAASDAGAPSDAGSRTPADSGGTARGRAAR